MNFKIEINPSLEDWINWARDQPMLQMRPSLKPDTVSQELWDSIDNHQKNLVIDHEIEHYLAVMRLKLRGR